MKVSFENSRPGQKLLKGGSGAMLKWRETIKSPPKKKKMVASALLSKVSGLD